MMKYIFVILFSLSANAYVPTVESLFRHGPNPEVSANGVAITLNVKKISKEKEGETDSSGGLVEESKAIDYYRIFFTRSAEILKVAQTRYENNSFDEASLISKTYIPSVSHLSFKGSSNETERSLFFSVLKSLVFNDGELLIAYLKSLNIPVKLNKDIINKEKVELLANYKKYLVAISQNRNAKKTEVNPLMPEDSEAKRKVDLLMGQSMYVDQRQVSLQKDNGRLAWFINAGSFEAIVSYKERHIQKLKLKTELGDIEFNFYDYWLANGTHFFPRIIQIKDQNSELYKIEVTQLRHYVEKEEDLLNRLKKWDLLLKGKTSVVPKPPFVL